MNILLVEDDNLTLMALQHSVESLGHKSLLARSGEEAIRQITENKIDFVISDIMMEGISGLSLVSVLRNVYFCEMPVILISTLDTQKMRDSSLALGASDFISKPFSIADLDYKIRKYAPPELNS